MFPRAGFLRVLYIFGRSQRHVKSRLGSGRRSLMRASSARFPPIDKPGIHLSRRTSLRARNFRWPPTTLPKLEKLRNEQSTGTPDPLHLSVGCSREILPESFYGFNDRRCFSVNGPFLHLSPSSNDRTYFACTLSYCQVSLNLTHCSAQIL